MRLTRTYRLGLVLCLLSMAACDRSGSNASGDPPATSYRVDNFTFPSDGATQTIRGASVTPAFFQAAKAQVWLGRLFVPEEYESGGRHVIILANHFWRQRFNGDPSWIGKTLSLNASDFTIVGVMSPSFEVPSGVDIWVPKSDAAK